MHEKAIHIQSGNALLSGTLCMPSSANKVPAVLMIHGSGPLDRDANMKGQRLNIFNAIAKALAKQGIASLRFDKRGCAHSTGDFLKAGFFDFVEDAAHALDVLVKLEGIEPHQIFIMGHSEGCVIAAHVMQRRSIAAGLILLCPFIEPIEVLLMRQAACIEKELRSQRGFKGVYYRLLFKLIGTPQEAQQRLIRRAKQADAATVRIAMHVQPAKWLRELLALDVPLIFSKINDPMLLIAGEKDLQCKPEDSACIAKLVSGPANVFIVNHMTHTLRINEKTPSLLNTACLTKKPISPSVYEESIRWINAQVRLFHEI